MQGSTTDASVSEDFTQQLPTFFWHSFNKEKQSASYHESKSNVMELQRSSCLLQMDLAKNFTSLTTWNSICPLVPATGDNLHRYGISSLENVIIHNCQWLPWTRTDCRYCLYSTYPRKLTCRAMKVLMSWQMDLPLNSRTSMHMYLVFSSDSLDESHWWLSHCANLWRPKLYFYVNMAVVSLSPVSSRFEIHDIKIRLFAYYYNYSVK